MYAYRYVDSASRKPVPKRFKALDKEVRTYFDTSRNVKTHPHELLKASTVYMWDPISPLQKYKEDQFKKDSSASNHKKWASVAPLYADYGMYLIKQYPITFLEYYIWPNTMKYYTPPVEFLEQYNTGVDSVHLIAKIWFGYKSNKVHSYFKDFNVSVLNFLPILVGVSNVLFLMGILCWILLRQVNSSNRNKVLFLAFTLWLINFGFSVFASPIALRFQLFPILVIFAFSVLLLEVLIKEAFGLDMKAIAKQIDDVTNQSARVSSLPA